MTIKEIKEFVKQVDGWLTDKEGEFLYRAAKDCAGRGVIVEIGSWYGKSTIWLAAGSQAGRQTPVYAVDHHRGSPEHYKKYGPASIWTFPDFQKNIKRAAVDDIIKPIVKTSAEAAPGFNQPIELLFIDGNHGYQSVKQDFQLWFPKIIEGGTIILHDTGGWAPWLGPILVTARYLYLSRKLKDLIIIDSMTIATKTATASFLEILKKFFKLPEWFFVTWSQAMTLINIKKLIRRLTKLSFLKSPPSF